MSTYIYLSSLAITLLSFIALNSSLTTLLRSIAYLYYIFFLVLLYFLFLIHRISRRNIYRGWVTTDDIQPSLQKKNSVYLKTFIDVH